MLLLRAWGHHSHDHDHHGIFIAHPGFQSAKRYGQKIPDKIPGHILVVPAIQATRRQQIAAKQHSCRAVVLNMSEKFFITVSASVQVGNKKT
jgi:hypothetical protein